MGAQHYAESGLKLLARGMTIKPEYQKAIDKARKLKPGEFFIYHEPAEGSRNKAATAKTEHKNLSSAFHRLLEESEHRRYRVCRTELHQVVVIRNDPDRPVDRLQVPRARQIGTAPAAEE